MPQRGRFRPFRTGLFEYVKEQSYLLNVFNFFIAGMHFAILSEFLENATVHGLGHISRSKSAFGKAIWTVIVVACFAGAITMIMSSYKEWQNSPVTTTITTHPITDLKFPAVTVCPPWRSNTALNHLLERVKDVNFTLELRQKLFDIAGKFSSIFQTGKMESV